MAVIGVTVVVSKLITADDLCRTADEQGSDDRMTVRVVLARDFNQRPLEHGIDVVGGSRATCESCHGLAPHPESANDKLNDHVSRIACQTCHIPAFARGGKPTKTYWDWSTAGRLDGDGKAIVEQDGKGMVTYSSQRGSAQWAENVTPDYVWFNGQIDHLTLSDAIDEHGWDVTEDEEAWRSHQKRRMEEDYGDDQW